MIRYVPGFQPQATAGETVPVPTIKPTATNMVSVEQAKALAAARQTQVLDYTRKRSATDTPLKTNLRTDGPTLEQWLQAGYTADKYPPEGYAELDSPALQVYKATSGGQKAAPHSVNDKKVTS